MQILFILQSQSFLVFVIGIIFVGLTRPKEIDENPLEESTTKKDMEV